MRKHGRRLLMQEKEYRWLEKGLRSMGFSSGMTLKEMAGVLPYMKLEEYPKGCVVCKEGAGGDHFYLVYKGGVEVLKKGRRKPLARLRPGEFFGEMSLLSGQPHSATVRTLEASLLFRLESDDFLRIVRRNPRVARTVHRTAEQRRAELAAA